MNMTPLRIRVLRIVKANPGYLISGLADVLVPRKWGWTRQGAARWGGSFVSPLAKEGLITIDRKVTCGVGAIRITAKGISCRGVKE